MTHDRLKILASCTSVIIALVIFSIKLYGFWQTGALAFMAGLMDSAIDALASIILAFAIFHSIQPPDKHHRFGHGKAEGLAAFLQALFILGSAGFLMYQAVLRFAEPKVVVEAGLGIGLTLVVLVLTGGLVGFQTYVIKKTGSVGIQADSLHYKGDILMNIGVLITLGLAGGLAMPLVDTGFAVLVVFYFVYTGVLVARTGLDMLMDRELSQENRDIIKGIINSHPDTHGLHDLRTRQSGKDVFIDFHLEIDGDMPLEKAHDITDDVQSHIKEKYPDAVITIHQEPAGIDDDRLDDRIKGKKH